MILDGWRISLLDHEWRQSSCHGIQAKSLLEVVLISFMLSRAIKFCCTSKNFYWQFKNLFFEYHFREFVYTSQDPKDQLLLGYVFVAFRSHCLQVKMPFKCQCIQVKIERFLLKHVSKILLNEDWLSHFYYCFLPDFDMLKVWLQRFLTNKKSKKNFLWIFLHFPVLSARCFALWLILKLFCLSSTPAFYWQSLYLNFYYLQTHLCNT